MSSNNPLVPTTENMVKEVIINMETDKPQAYQTKKDKSISNESNKGMTLNKSSSLDNSRASGKTENKTRYISSASLSGKSIKKQQQKEIRF